MSETHESEMSTETTRYYGYYTNNEGQDVFVTDTRAKTPIEARAAILNRLNDEKRWLDINAWRLGGWLIGVSRYDE